MNLKNMVASNMNFKNIPLRTLGHQMWTSRIEQSRTLTVVRFQDVTNDFTVTRIESQ